MQTSKITLRLKELLEYVYRLGQMNQEPVFELNEFDNFKVTQSQFSGCSGVHYGGNDEEGAPVWLRIDRLKRTPYPLVPTEIKPWISVSSDPDQAVTVKDVIVQTLPEDESSELLTDGRISQSDIQDSMQSTKRQIVLKDVSLKLSEFEETRNLINQYINHDWHNWAKKERPKRKTIKLYDTLFNLLQNMESRGDDQPLELIWGLGIIRCRINGRVIDYPLIEQRVEIELNKRNGAIQIRPSNQARKLALAAFMSMDNPGVEPLMRFEKQQREDLSDVEFSPFNKDSYEPVLRYAATQLHEAGSYWPDINTSTKPVMPDLSDELLVTDCWCLYAKPRDTQPLLQDLEKFIRKLDAIDETNIPAPTRRLVEPLSNKPQDVVNEDLEATLRAEELFFPKPYNDAQIKIIQRLQSNYGVVVQGPPGTGKTHTIANIISHYLATGRRVLVTSSGESALLALREQIPASIRELTISLLTSERQGTKQLEIAVQHLAEIVSKTDSRELKQQVETLSNEVEQRRAQITDIDRELLKGGLKQIKQVDDDLVNGESPCSVLQLAEKVMTDAERHQWFPDKLSGNSDSIAQFDISDLKRLRAARRSVADNIIYLGVKLPPLSEIPDSSEIAAIHNDLVILQKLSNDAKIESLPKLNKDAHNVKKRASILVARMKEFFETCDEIKKSAWQYEILLHWVKQGLGGESTALIEGMLDPLEELLKQRDLYLKNPIHVPDPGDTRSELDRALMNLSAGTRAFGLLSVGKSRVKVVIAQIEVNGETPRSARQWQLVEHYLRFQDEAKRFIVKWNSIAEEYGLPELRYQFGSSLKSLKQLQTQLQKLKDLSLKVWPEISGELAVLIPENLTISRLVDNEQIARLAIATLHNFTQRDAISSQRKRLQNIQKRLIAYKGKISEAFRELSKGSIGNPNISSAELKEAWQNLLSDLSHLHSLKPHFDVLTEVSAKIAASGGKKWAKQLLTIPHLNNGDDKLLPNDCIESWQWHRQSSYLQELNQHDQYRKLNAKKLRLESELNTLFIQLVKAKTNLGLQVNLTEKVHGGLVRFVSAIGKLGKGTGKKRAPRYRKEAHNAMQECYEGVPCWIMPTWRISESMPSEFASFDLVVIDEASQSDISALPAIMRAKKLLIVGDDKQVSPTAAFISEDKIHQLSQSYLQNQPFAEMLIPGVSLYDLASVTYPAQRIMLSEHFRCVEPIIRFSMRYYGNALVPLRLPTAVERIDPPLLDIYVNNGRRDDHSGINEMEIGAIVDEIARIVQDPKFKGRSIGVISLIGSEQATAVQDALLQSLGEETYQRFAIACGDSATFQGKEKDIIFLSMVVGPKQGSVLSKREYEQRFNVALSRARDRMVLVRSIKDSDLRNSQDLRAQVLRHFSNPMLQRNQHEDALQRCESAFERDLVERLTELSYQVQVHVQIGPIDIDIVVESENGNRIAIELDGDNQQTEQQWLESIRNQQILQRVGWVFWRCWASNFTINPDKCIDDLLATLKKNKIKPSDREVTHVSAYTEYREYTYQRTAFDAPLTSLASPDVQPLLDYPV